MSYINVVMSLKDFVPYINDIICKSNGILYVEKKNDDNSLCHIVVDITNYRSVIKSYRERYLNFFITSKEIKDAEANFYEDDLCHYVIEGIGGRETEEYIERIGLRLVSKNPDKGIKKIFNSIGDKLKKDDSIGRGVEGGSSFHKNFFYSKSYLGNKIFKTDIYNEKAPIITILS